MSVVFASLFCFDTFFSGILYQLIQNVNYSISILFDKITIYKSINFFEGKKPNVFKKIKINK